MADATVVVARLDEVGSGTLACLSADEWARAGRFRRARDGQAWAAARAVLRSVLADAFGIAAAEVELAVRERGRTALADPHGACLAVNLTHAGGLALVATSRVAAVGVDVEAVRPVPDLLDVARRVLRPSACATIEAADPAAREASFFRAWVRHEARLKCRGTGLVEPDEDDGRTDDLTIADIPLEGRHAAAVAVARAGATIDVVPCSSRWWGAA